MKEAYYIWLSRCFGEGSPIADALLEEFGSAEAVWEKRSQLDKLCPKLRIPKDRITACTLEEAEQIYNRSAELGIQVLTPESPHWPQRLSSISNPPVVLYLRGDAALIGRLDEMPALGVVGTRTMSTYGAQAAELFSMGLAAAGMVVVSGMAKGIDTMAHKGALKGEGKTIAVLGCGLDSCYPSGNEEMMEIISHNGAVVSEYPINEAPVGTHFPIRNRLISALSVGVLIIEAKPRSGSLITANLAAEQGRDVFVLMTDYCRRGAKALSKLIEDGAKPVASVSDIIIEYQVQYAKTLKPELADKALRAFDEYTMPYRGKKQPSQPARTLPKNDAAKQAATPPPVAMRRAVEPPDSLSEDAKAVFAVLDITQSRHVDQLAAETGLSASRLLAAVTELEMEGLAQNLPGRHYLKQSEEY